MTEFDFYCRTRVVCGPGSFAQAGELAWTLGFRRTLITADPGIVGTGYAERLLQLLDRAGVEAQIFSDFGENPDTAMAERGRVAAHEWRADSLIGLGGGSSMDCAKAIAFLVSNGGTMRDYRGHGKAEKPLPPMIGVPTTTGTGSEAQSYALISDAESHVKMACGNPDAAFRIAILDPELAVSQPRRVLAASGYDALSHAVETWVSSRRTLVSETFSLQAWRLLSTNLECAFAGKGDLETFSRLQVGAFLAGLAIENSMLGAGHACANPLTAHYGTIHGAAIALMLPHVARWNEPVVGARYRELAADLPARLADLGAAADLPARLRDVEADPDDFDILAKEAAQQWTGNFNPRPFSAEAALELYEAAW